MSVNKIDVNAVNERSRAAAELGRIGGKKTAKNMSSEDRIKRAKKAVTVREYKRALRQHALYEQEGKEFLDWYKWTPLRAKIAKLGHFLGISNADLAQILQCSITRVNALRLYDGNKVPVETKKLVKEEQQNKCGHCFAQKELQIHHIENSNNHNPANLIALCIPCHNKADKERRINFLKKV
jgi:hypothetical protein